MLSSAPTRPIATRSIAPPPSMPRSLSLDPAMMSGISHLGVHGPARVLLRVTVRTGHGSTAS
eukprot:4322809-Alexandrium_andersonii.AAC.1